jgi:chemotaxis protein CheC
MAELTKLNPNEIENFTKIINHYIASKTSKALSSLLSEPVTYHVMMLDTKYFNPQRVKLTSDEIKMCGVKLSGKGDIHIEICYAIKMKYAKEIAGILLGQTDIKEIDELGTSAIQEVANILTGSFFNAMSLGTGFRVELSTPDYLQSDLITLINSTKDVITSKENSVIIADAELVGEKSGIRFHMLIMQNVSNARKLLVNHIAKSKQIESSSIDNFNSELNSFDDNSQSKTYRRGSENPELDSLLEEFLPREE